MGRYLDIAGFKSRTIMPPADVDRIIRSRFERNTADAGASTAMPETKFGEVVVTGVVLSILAVFAAAITHDAANYATLTVYKRTAGGAPTAIGSLSTQTADIPAGVPVAFTIASDTITAEDALTLAIVKSGTGVIVPAVAVDVRPSPNYVEAASDREQAYLEARLRKRYDIPFDKDGRVVPEAVLRWLEALVTRACYGRRGFNPTSEQDAEIILTRATTAEAEIKEASDSETGLFDLPLSQGAVPDVSGVTQAFPLSYSEQSPYVAFDRQVCDGQQEDSQGRGRGS